MSLIRVGLAGLAALAVAGADSPRPSRGGPSPDSAAIEASVDWASVDLPKSLRKRIHLTTVDLPAFPMADSLLRDPRKWPAAIQVGAAVCSLRMSVTEFDVSGRPIRSLDEVGPEASAYSLHYEFPPKGFRARYGPASWWRTKDGKIIERGWTTFDTTRTIRWGETFWPSGVLEWSWVNRGRTSGWMEFFDHSEWQGEVFNASGALLGISFQKKTWWWREGPYYFWKGKRVTPMQFSDETSKLVKYANARYWHTGS